MELLYLIDHMENGTIKVITPYNPAFISDLKKTFGSRRWDKNGWILPSQNIDEVRSMMRKHYGCDDRMTPMATVEVEAKQDIRATCNPVMAYGRVVARASGRDSGAFVGEYVTMEPEGDIYSAGTTKYWETVVKKGTRFKILHVVDNLIEPENTEEENFSLISIVKENPEIDVIKEEYRTLANRMAAIERQAKEMGVSKKDLLGAKKKKEKKTGKGRHVEVK